MEVLHILNRPYLWELARGIQNDYIFPEQVLDKWVRFLGKHHDEVPSRHVYNSDDFTDTDGQQVSAQMSWFQMAPGYPAFNSLLITVPNAHRAEPQQPQQPSI